LFGGNGYYMLYLNSLQWRSNEMMSQLYAVHCFLLNLIHREDGQDLVEYALAVALIAFGAVSAMSYVASSLNNGLTWIAVMVATAPSQAPAAGY
jgi:Flp pilus assembly pilin Flp